MKPRLQYLVANKQLVLCARRPSRLWRWVAEWWIAVAVAICGVAFLGALFLPEVAS